jgi:hypothetical protein
MKAVAALAALLTFGAISLALAGCGAGISTPIGGASIGVGHPPPLRPY